MARLPLDCGLDSFVSRCIKQWHDIRWDPWQNEGKSTYEAKGVCRLACDSEKTRLWSEMVYASCSFLSTSHYPTKLFKKIYQSAPYTGESQRLVSPKTPSSWETQTYNGLTVPNTTSTWIQLNPYPACSMNFDAFHGFFFGLRKVKLAQWIWEVQFEGNAFQWIILIWEGQGVTSNSSSHFWDWWDFWRSEGRRC